MNFCQLFKACFPYISHPEVVENDSDSSETYFRIAIPNNDKEVRRSEHKALHDDSRTQSQEELFQHEFENYDESIELISLNNTKIEKMDTENNSKQ